MANISAFKSQITQGGSRPNQFRVKLTFPGFVGAAGTVAAQSAEFLCRSSLMSDASFPPHLRLTCLRSSPLHPPP